MPLSLSLTPDAVSGRRTYLIGTAVGAISLFLPWFNGLTLGFFGNTAESLSGFQVGGWVPLMVTTILPFGYLITKESIPKWAKTIALLLCAYALTTETAQALRSTPVSVGLTILRTGGLGQWLFIAAQAICFVAILRFPKPAKKLV